jgi:DNA-binding transcriptional MerR regulator
MARKSFSAKLSDGNYYKFSERNREDNNLLSYQERLREFKIKQIQELIKDKETQQMLLMQQINRNYSPMEVSAYIFSNPAEIRKCCYDSFKINNPGICFNDFCKLLEENAETIYMRIDDLENPIQELTVPEKEEAAAEKKRTSVRKKRKQ